MLVYKRFFELKIINDEYIFKQCFNATLKLELEGVIKSILINEKLPVVMDVTQFKRTPLSKIDEKFL